MTSDPRYLGGYAIAGQQPVLVFDPPTDTRPTLAASIAGVVDAFKARKAARNAELAAQRAKLLADSLIWCATVPTREQVRDGWLSQLDSAERELLRLDRDRQTGRWTELEFARVCRSARKRRAEAMQALMEMES